MEMYNIMSMINIFLSVMALCLLLGGFKRYSDISAYRHLGVGFVVTLVIIILVQIHTVVSPQTREWYLKLSPTAMASTAILFYLFIFRTKQTFNKMSTKNVAFFNEDPSDTFVSYLVDGATTFNPNKVVNLLPSTPTMTAPWFQATDANSVIDACAVIGEDSTAVATFQRADTTTYTKDSQEFVGGRPPHRPW